MHLTDFLRYLARDQRTAAPSAQLADAHQLRTGGADTRPPNVRTGAR
jgi:hypothetical protein